MLSQAAGATGIGALEDLIVQNNGQWSDASVRYALSRSDAQVLFRQDRADFLMQGGSGTSLFSISPAGNASQLQGGQAAATRVGFLNGQAGYTQVPTWHSVTYQGAFDGIDLTFKTEDKGIKYELDLAAGASVGAIALDYSGVSGLSLDSAGNLVIATANGNVTDSAPVAYQVRGETVEFVGVKYRLLDNDTVGFEVTGSYDHTRALVIDPNLAWTWSIGGKQDELDTQVEVSGTTTFIAGSTQSIDLWTDPVAGGVAAGPNTRPDGLVTSDKRLDWDAYVARVDGDALTWITFVGGSGDDLAKALALDEAFSTGAKLVIGGATSSSDLPGAKNLYQGGDTDGFIAMVDAGTGAVDFSRYVGTTRADVVNDVTVRDLAVAGIWTASRIGAAGASYLQTDTTYDSDILFQLVDVSPALNVTYVGPSGTPDLFPGNDHMIWGEAMTLDYASDGKWILGGRSMRVAPVAGEVWPTGDAFAALYGADGTPLGYGTYHLNGNPASFGDETLTAVVIDRVNADQVYLIGSISASEYQADVPYFPIVKLTAADRPNGPYHSSIFGLLLLNGSWSGSEYGQTSQNYPNNLYNGGSSDVFVGSVGIDLGPLTWSTYLGGEGSDTASSATIYNGQLVVAGTTFSQGFPTTDVVYDAVGLLPTAIGALDTTYNGSGDGFVTAFSTQGKLLWSTFYGTGGYDAITDMAINSATGITIGGISRNSTSAGPAVSQNLPVNEGGTDAFVARLIEQGASVAPPLAQVYLAPDIPDLDPAWSFGGEGYYQFQILFSDPGSVRDGDNLAINLATLSDKDFAVTGGPINEYYYGGGSGIAGFPNFPYTNQYWEPAVPVRAEPFTLDGSGVTTARSVLVTYRAHAPMSDQVWGKMNYDALNDVGDNGTYVIYMLPYGTSVDPLNPVNPNCHRGIDSPGVASASGGRIPTLVEELQPYSGNYNQDATFIVNIGNNTLPPTAEIVADSFAFPAQYPVTLTDAYGVNYTSYSLGAEFQVRYYDPDGVINWLSLDDWDVAVSGPKDTIDRARLIGVSSESDESELIATYRILAPGGTWDATDNGFYRLYLRPGQVTDSGNNYAVVLGEESMTEGDRTSRLVENGGLGRMEFHIDTLAPKATVVGGIPNLNSQNADGVFKTETSKTGQQVITFKVQFEDNEDSANWKFTEDGTTRDHPEVKESTVLYDTVSKWTSIDNLDILVMRVTGQAGYDIWTDTSWPHAQDNLLNSPFLAFTAYQAHATVRMNSSGQPDLTVESDGRIVTATYEISTADGKWDGLWKVGGQDWDGQWDTKSPVNNPLDDEGIYLVALENNNPLQAWGVTDKSGNSAIAKGLDELTTSSSPEAMDLILAKTLLATRDGYSDPLRPEGVLSTANVNQLFRQGYLGSFVVDGNSDATDKTEFWRPTATLVGPYRTDGLPVESAGVTADPNIPFITHIDTEGNFLIGIRYDDNIAIDPTTFSSDDITVERINSIAGDGVQSAKVSIKSITRRVYEDGEIKTAWADYNKFNSDDNLPGRSRTVWYEIAPTDAAQWGNAQNGRWKISLKDGAVKDLAGNEIKGAELGQFDSEIGIMWSTYFGGKQNDSIQAVTLDGAGNIYVAGYTQSSNSFVNNGLQAQDGFPIVNAADPAMKDLVAERMGNSNVTLGGYDAFVAKFSSDGHLAWSRYLGGKGDDYAYAIGEYDKPDGSRVVYVAGETTSVDSDAFIVSIEEKVSAQFVTTLTISPIQVLNFTDTTGSGDEAFYSIAIAANGDAVVAGYARGADPSNTTQTPSLTTGSFGLMSGEDKYNGFTDVIVARFNSQLAGQWLTRAGSPDDDLASAVTIDSKGNIIVVGETAGYYSLQNSLMGVNRAADYHSMGQTDAFVARITETGGLPDWGAYIKLANGATLDDRALGVTTDGTTIYITGETQNAVAPDHNLDIFVVAYDTAGDLKSPVWNPASFDSGVDEGAYAIFYDAVSQTVFLGGYGYKNANEDFLKAPTYPQHTYFHKYAEGAYDGYILRVQRQPDNKANVVWSTYFGGSGGDYIQAMAVQSQANPAFYESVAYNKDAKAVTDPLKVSPRFVVVGNTWSKDLPVAGTTLDTDFGAWPTDQTIPQNIPSVAAQKWETQRAKWTSYFSPNTLAGGTYDGFIASFGFEDTGAPTADLTITDVNIATVDAGSTAATRATGSWVANGRIYFTVTYTDNFGFAPGNDLTAILGGDDILVARMSGPRDDVAGLWQEPYWSYTTADRDAYEVALAQTKWPNASLYYVDGKLPVYARLATFENGLSVRDDLRKITAVYSVAEFTGDGKWLDNDTGLYKVFVQTPLTPQSEAGVRDANGNWVDSQTLGWFHVDTVAPTVTLISDAPFTDYDNRNTGTTVLNIRGGGNGDSVFTFEIRDNTAIDVSALLAEKSVLYLSIEESGNHTFRLVEDAAGPITATLLGTDVSYDSPVVRATYRIRNDATVFRSVAGDDRNGVWTFVLDQLAQDIVATPDASAKLVGNTSINLKTSFVVAVDALAPGEREVTTDGIDHALISISASDVTRAGGDVYGFQLTYKDRHNPYSPAGTDDKDPNAMVENHLSSASPELDPDRLDIADTNLELPAARHSRRQLWDHDTNGNLLDAGWDPGIDISTIDSFDVEIVRTQWFYGLERYPGLSNTQLPDHEFIQRATVQRVTMPSQDEQSLIVTYEIVPPGGYWDYEDSGTYEVWLYEDEVSDTGNNFNTTTYVLGEFTVRFPTSLVYGDSNALAWDLTGQAFEGSGNDVIKDSATDSKGNVVVVGTTFSGDLPSTGFAGTERAGYNGYGDVMLAMFAPDGTRLWTRYFSPFAEDAGGDLLWHGLYDDGLCLVVDAADNIYIGGTTQIEFDSAAIAPDIRADRVGFVAKFDSAGVLARDTGGAPLIITGYDDGSAHTWTTGPIKGWSEVTGLALDTDTSIAGGVQSLVIAGTTSRATTDRAALPLAGTTLAADAAVTATDLVFAPQWSLVSYNGNDESFRRLGGAGADAATSVGTFRYVDPVSLANVQAIYIGGATASRDFLTQSFSRLGTPLAAPYDPILGGARDGFISRLDIDGAGDPTMSWASFVGGTADDWVNALALDSRGDLYIVGDTSSADLGVSEQASQTAYGGGGDGFVVRMGAMGTQAWSSYLGGSAYDGAADVAVDRTGGIDYQGDGKIDVEASDHVIVVGNTQSMDFRSLLAQRQDGWDPTPNGLSDAYVVRFATGASLAYDLTGTLAGLAPGMQLESSYLGGSRDDVATTVTIRSYPDNNATTIGNTASYPFDPDVQQVWIDEENAALVVEPGLVRRDLLAANYIWVGGHTSSHVRAMEFSQSQFSTEFFPTTVNGEGRFPSQPLGQEFGPRDGFLTAMDVRDMWDYPRIAPFGQPTLREMPTATLRSGNTWSDAASIELQVVYALPPNVLLGTGTAGAFSGFDDSDITVTCELLLDPSAPNNIAPDDTAMASLVSINATFVSAVVQADNSVLATYTIVPPAAAAGKSVSMTAWLNKDQVNAKVKDRSGVELTVSANPGLGTASTTQAMAIGRFSRIQVPDLVSSPTVAFSGITYVADNQASSPSATVTSHDESALSLESLSTGNILVTGTGDYRVSPSVTYVEMRDNLADNFTTNVLHPQGSLWLAGDIAGTYDVNLVHGTVFDVDGNTTQGATLLASLTPAVSVAPVALSVNGQSFYDGAYGSTNVAAPYASSISTITIDFASLIPATVMPVGFTVQAADLSVDGMSMGGVGFAFSGTSAKWSGLSLSDGVHTFEMKSSDVRDADGAWGLDGDSDGVAGGNLVFQVQQASGLTPAEQARVDGDKLMPSPGAAIAEIGWKKVDQPWSERTGLSGLEQSVVASLEAFWGRYVVNDTADWGFLTLHNTGDQVLDITGFSVVGTDEFQVAPPGSDFSILPGQTQDIAVTVAGVDVGRRHGLVSFSTNDSLRPTVQLDLYADRGWLFVASAQLDRIAGTGDFLTIEFSEDVSGSLSSSDVTLVEVATGTPVPLGSTVMTLSPDGKQAVWDLTALALPAGNYTVTVSAAGVTSTSSGQVLDGNRDFFAGDNYTASDSYIGALVMPLGAPLFSPLSEAPSMAVAEAPIRVGAGTTGSLNVDYWRSESGWSVFAEGDPTIEGLIEARLQLV